MRETVGDSHQLKETARVSQQLYCTGKVNVKKPATMRDSERDSEKQTATVGDSERHLDVPWNQER